MIRLHNQSLKKLLSLFTQIQLIFLNNDNVKVGNTKHTSDDKLPKQSFCKSDLF